MTQQRTSSLMKTYPLRVDIVILTVSALTLLTLGLSLPVLTLKKMVFWTDTFSILSGIRYLIDVKDYVLAAVLFFFSIVFPYAKLIGLFAIWAMPLTAKERGVALDWLGILGKWSMLDVFVAAVTVVIVKFGHITEARPREGLYYFGGAILMSMLLTLLIERVAKRHHFSGPSKYSI